MGRFTRRLRLLTGLSQQQIAADAGLSQGVVSRIESGRAVHTPLVVVQKIHDAMRRRLASFPPSMLSDATRQLMKVPVRGRAFETISDESLGTLAEAFARIPPALQAKTLVALRHVAETLAASSLEHDDDPMPKRRRVRGSGTRPDGTAASRPDWEAWMRGLGRLIRRIRQLAGLSQAELANRAGVSQGALSRLEAHAVHTPMIVVMRVNTALRGELVRRRVTERSQESRHLMNVLTRGIPSAAAAFDDFPVTAHPAVEQVVHLYWTVPARHRTAFARTTLAIVAIAESRRREELRKST